MPKASKNPGTVLKALMDEYQLNPTKLAKEIDLNQSSVRLISIGKMRISAPIALRFAKYFGTTPEYWIDLQNKFDLVEAANDAELGAILKGITKAKKPGPAKKTVKAPAAKKAGAKKRAVKASAAKTRASAPAKTKKPARAAKAAKPAAVKSLAPKKRGRKPKVKPVAEPVQEVFKPRVVLIKKKDISPSVPPSWESGPTDSFPEPEHSGE
jgi:addiction module HigA family antidote